MVASMSVSALVAQYGYWMVLLGAVAEGETVLLAAGFAAHRGLLQLPEVVLIAWLASSASDQACFYLGRRHGARLLARFGSLQAPLDRLRPWVARHPNLAVLGVRFVYGLRTAGPIALGMLGVPRWKFALLNLLGAALWALLFGLLGYQFGNALQWLLDDLRSVEEAVLGLLLLAALLLPLALRLRRWRAGRLR
jgi:membrane protein DedA with SNARE-associated domain